MVSFGRHKLSKVVESKIDWKFLLLCPSILGIVIFYIIPSIQMLILAFSRNSEGSFSFSVSAFVALFNNAAFTNALINTAIFFGVGLILSFAIAIGLANWLFIMKVKPIYLAFVLLPTVLPTSTLVQTWQLIWEHVIFFDLIKHQIPVDWWVVLLLFLWKYCGLMILVIYYRMCKIPKSFFEVAEIEGANGRQKFLKITLPEIKGALAFSGLIFIISAFKVYREIYFLYGNYPSKRVYMIQHYLNNLFASMDFTALSAATTLFFGSITFVLLALVYLKRDVIREFYNI